MVNGAWMSALGRTARSPVCQGDRLAQVVIENPVLNSAFEEPRRHFLIGPEGATNEIIESRRVSSYYVPIPPPKKKGKQLALATEAVKHERQENQFINQLRGLVGAWRGSGRPGITRTTSLLFEHWTSPDRERPLFFCQLEAVETTVYLAEVAPRLGQGWLDDHLRQMNETANSTLPRIAMKMATGSGKTVVMAMLIAWQALNKMANPHDRRFSDAFLVVTPGITIRDRLLVLLPTDPHNYYKALDLIPPEFAERLNQTKVVVTNFHAFLAREKVAVATTTKKVLRPNGGESPFKETPDQVVRRVCRDLGTKRNIIVLNDEAHHCYRRRAMEVEAGNTGAATPAADAGVALTADEKEEVKQREEEARIWLSGLEAVAGKIGVRTVYDLSATPFFLKGSGYPEGTLFPWVVSDFSLIDAIESGIVKVPRVPVSDDAMSNDMPTYRDLWVHIRDELPKKGARTDPVSGEPKLPGPLEGALLSLYYDYKKDFERWEQLRAEGDGHSRLTPPVFIVVCNNTNVSKLVFDFVSGWEKVLPGGEVRLVPGQLDLFSNVEKRPEGDVWSAWPNTILVDSRQLESGEVMSADFKKIAAREIDEFKTEYRQRFPGADVEKLTDEDLLREVMNTVGKPGRLGEQIRCVVSVSMLTEGWDANTVTHILGVRAFGTQLLCEQVIGRALRRTNYVPKPDGLFETEYAEVYGVPFQFMPVQGTDRPTPPPPPLTHVRALADRIACEITFPRLVGYRYELPSERLHAAFDDTSGLSLSTESLPTKTEAAPIIGEMELHTLDDLKKKRLQTVAFRLASLVLERYLLPDGAADGSPQTEDRKPWLFPQLLAITRDWLDHCLHCKDNTFPQLLLLVENAHDAADKIYQAIVRGEEGEKRLLPILQPYDTVGSTTWVDFDTARSVYPTAPDKCHVSHVVCDTESWEQKMAQVLEDMPEVLAYVKNQNLGFYIPYSTKGDERRYVPDFIARVATGAGGRPAAPGDVFNLVLEVSGEAKKEKADKVAWARSMWIPAANNHGGFGRWGFLEISDPWDAANTIRAFLGSIGGENT